MSLEKPLLEDSETFSQHQIFFHGAPEPTRIYCVKVYPGLNIKQISQIDTKNCKVDIVFALILRMNVDKLDKELRETIRNKLVIRINHVEFYSRLFFKEVYLEGKCYFLVILRETTTCAIDYECMRETPFDKPKIQLKLKLSEIEVDSQDGVKFLWFNFYKNKKEQSVNISIKRDTGQLPEYRIRYRKFKMVINEVPRVGNVKNFPLVVYELQLVRRPLNKLILTFTPMMLLSIFTILTFNTHGLLLRKMALLATIFLAYVAFIPSLRNETPSFSYMTLPDLAIICQLLANIGCLIYSVLEEERYQKTRLMVVIYQVSLALIFLPFILLLILTVKFVVENVVFAGSIENCIYNKRHVFKSSDYDNRALSYYK